MPPILATFLTLAFICYLFRRDFREHPNVTPALWIPFFWVLISGSRFVSEWLGLFGIHLGGVSVEEGSPIDAVFFFGLIGGGLLVLHKRRIDWSKFIRDNGWIAVFLAYCLVAVIWSDFPFVALKRWVKLFGQPIMVLILLTEPDPIEALVRLMKRCAYILIPVSILFIKYYPQFGRGFSSWTGEGYNTGITGGKNNLGFDCMILGIFFFWHFLRTRQLPKSSLRRNELFLTIGFLCMIWWLFSMAHSSTALVSCVVGVLVIVFLGFRFVSRQHIGLYTVVVVALLLIVELTMGFSDKIVEMLGKDQTLTGRTELWKALLHWDVNPVFGVGFESFWLGERRETLVRMFRFGPNEAHNGYLETYLNLGLIGLVITLGMLIGTFLKARRELWTDFDFGRFRLGYLAAFVLYNWTEAAFRTHAFPFFVFFLIAIDYAEAKREPDSASTPDLRDEIEPSYVSA